MRPSDGVRQQSLTKVWYSHNGLRKSATNWPIRKNVSSGCNIGLHTLVYRKHRMKLHGESTLLVKYEKQGPVVTKFVTGKHCSCWKTICLGSLDLSDTDAAMNIFGAVSAPTRLGTLVTDAKQLTIFSRRAVH
jgi:hypothetical protein